MTELALQIKALIERNGNLEAARKHYDILKSSIDEKEVELLSLKQQLDTELEEIEALEKLSIQSILDQLMVTKDQKLEKKDKIILSCLSRLKKNWKKHRADQI